MVVRDSLAAVCTKTLPAQHEMSLGMVRYIVLMQVGCVIILEQIAACSTLLGPVCELRKLCV